MAFGPIIVYDSGVGGLTVARKLMKHCPNHDLVYLADNDWFPYGNKDERLLVARVNSILSVLKCSFGPQAIVVACNTAATAIADQLGNRGSVPLYGVIPPIHQAAITCDPGNAVLLATPATLERSKIKELVATYPGSLSAIGSLELVYLAEQKMAGHSGLCGTRLLDILEPLMPASLRSDVTTVIFGCTHFPWLKCELGKAFPNARHWLDPATEVALTVQRDLSLNTVANRKPSHALVLTGACRFDELQHVFTAEGFPRVLQLNSLFTSNGRRLK